MELYSHRGHAHREARAGAEESGIWAGGGGATQGEGEIEGEGSGGQEGG